MSNATVTVTPSKMEVTPMRVKWNGIDLGGTLKSVITEAKYMKTPVKADQYGSTIIDKRLQGWEGKVTLEIAEVRDVTKWAKIFPNAVLNGVTSITFGLPIGASSLDQAQQLVLHPIVNDDSDTSQDHTIFKAFPTEESTLTYGPDAQTSAKLVFDVYPLISGTAMPTFFRFGNP